MPSLESISAPSILIYNIAKAKKDNLEHEKKRKMIELVDDVNWREEVCLWYVQQKSVFLPIDDDTQWLHSNTYAKYQTKKMKY